MHSIFMEDTTANKTNSFDIPSSSSPKIVLNKSTSNTHTNNTSNSSGNTSSNTKVGVQRRPIQLEGYRQLCFDGISGYSNAIT